MGARRSKRGTIPTQLYAARVDVWDMSTTIYFGPHLQPLRVPLVALLGPRFRGELVYMDGRIVWFGLPIGKA